MNSVNDASDILNKVKNIEEVKEKIALLESFLEERADSLDISVALAQDKLAEILATTTAPDPALCEKAADTWEKLWLRDSLPDKKAQRKALQRAFVNYRTAAQLYAEKRDQKSAENARDKARLIRAEQGPLPRIGKITGTAVTLGSFILSGSFFSYTFTGFAVATVETSQSIWLGAFFFVLAIAGLFFTLKLWK